MFHVRTHEIRIVYEYNDSETVSTVPVTNTPDTSFKQTTLWCFNVEQMKITFHEWLLLCNPNAWIVEHRRTKVTHPAMFSLAA